MGNFGFKILLTFAILLAACKPDSTHRTQDPNFAPKDTSDIYILVPSNFTLNIGQKGLLRDNNGRTYLTLKDIHINRPCTTIMCLANLMIEGARVVVSNPGGCGVNAGPSCLGPPAYEQEFFLATRSEYQIEALGIHLTLNSVTDDSANFDISSSFANCSPQSNDFVCSTVTTGANPPEGLPTVCGCPIECDEFLLVGFAEGTWPDGSAKASYSCVNMPPP